MKVLHSDPILKSTSRDLKLSSRTTKTSRRILRESSRDLKPSCRCLKLSRRYLKLFSRCLKLSSRTSKTSSRMLRESSAGTKHFAGGLRSSGWKSKPQSRSRTLHSSKVTVKSRCFRLGYTLDREDFLVMCCGSDLPQFGPPPFNGQIRHGSCDLL